jgi:hypothetical protein
MKPYYFILLAFVACKAQQTTKTTVIVHHDTLVTREIHKDSIIHNIYSKDTVFIHENRLTVKYVYKNDSSAFIGGTVLPDTIIKVHYDTTKVTTVIKEVAKPKTTIEGFCQWFTILALLGLSSYFGVKALKL